MGATMVATMEEILFEKAMAASELAVKFGNDPMLIHQEAEAWDAHYQYIKSENDPYGTDLDYGDLR